MLRRNFLTGLGLAMSAPTLAAAGAFQQRQRFTLPVIQLDANSFEIVEADGAGNTQIWCAAGLYARKGLRQRGGELYIERARGPSQSLRGRKSVVFTTQAVPGAFNSLSLGVRRAGSNFSMAHAYALCRQNPHLKLRTADGQLIRY